MLHARGRSRCSLLFVNRGLNFFREFRRDLLHSMFIPGMFGALLQAAKVAIDTYVLQ